MWPGDELRPCATGYIGFEDLIWVVQIGNDQIEFGKIIHQIFGQFTMTGKKAGQRAGLDCLDQVDQAALLRGAEAP